MPNAHDRSDAAPRVLRERAPTVLHDLAATNSTVCTSMFDRLEKTYASSAVSSVCSASTG